MHIFNTMLSPGLGGIEAAFVRYIPLLQSLGHRVTCVVHPTAAIVKDIPAGVEVLRLANYSQWDVSAILRARKLLRDYRPDAVMPHTKRGLVLFGLARLGLSIPLVHILHRPRYEYLGLAERILCVNPTLIPEAVKRGVHHSKLVYVPNFLVSNGIAPTPTAYRTPPVIGIAARMVPEKGLELFLEALALLKAQNIAYQAHIGGDGPLRAALQARAETLGVASQIVWKGWVEDMDRFLAAIDVFCSSSLLESFGLATLEAMQAGKPIVATRTIGSGLLITPGVNGVLCAINAEAIAEGVARVLADPALGQKLGLKAQEEAKAYLLPTVAAQVEKVLRAVTR